MTAEMKRAAVFRSSTVTAVTVRLKNVFSNKAIKHCQTEFINYKNIGLVKQYVSIWLHKIFYNLKHLHSLFKSDEFDGI